MGPDRQADARRSRSSRRRTSGLRGRPGPARWWRTDRLAEQALRAQRLGQLGVGGGEQVRLDAAADLRGQLVGAGERQAHLRAGEVGGAGGERVFSDAAAETTMRGRWSPGSAPPSSSPPPQPAAPRPARRPGCGARLIRARPSPTWPSRSRWPGALHQAQLLDRVAGDGGGSRCGPASISTSPITPSTSTERTTPGKRLRADSPSPAGGASGRERRRSISPPEHAGDCARHGWSSAPGAVPAAQRVGADAQRSCGFTKEQIRAIRA